MDGLNVESLTQMAFSIGVAWYLLAVFSKKIDRLAENVEQSQRDTTESKEMFEEIKDLIQEVSKLAQTVSESVKVQNELTKNALRHLEAARWDRSQK